MTIKTFIMFYKNKPGKCERQWSLLDREGQWLLKGDPITVCFSHQIFHSIETVDNNNKKQKKKRLKFGIWFVSQSKKKT